MKQIAMQKPLADDFELTVTDRSSTVFALSRVKQSISMDCTVAQPTASNGAQTTTPTNSNWNSSPSRVSTARATDSVTFFQQNKNKHDAYHDQKPLARPRGPVNLAVVSSSRKLLLLGLLSVACGGPRDQASTTTGITTVAHTAGSSTDSSSMDSSSASSSSTSGDTASTSTSYTSTGVAPDLPDFETLGPTKGCGKIDILFVINDGGTIDGPADVAESSADALAIHNGTNAFINAMQEQAAEYDLHVMTVKGDPEWSGYYGWSSCCVPDKPCDQYGQFPCDDPTPDYLNDCDYTLGAGMRYPAGFMASNRDCELAGDRRYLTEEQDDFAAAFECILNVGQTGRGDQRYLEAMLKAVGPDYNAPDGCNAGFLRPDAMLVVVVLSDYADDKSPGTPGGLAASLIAAKGGYTGGIVVVGILGSYELEEKPDDCYNDPEDRARKFVEGFPSHVLGSFCAPDIGANLVAAIEVIETACAEFVPPG